MRLRTPRRGFTMIEVLIVVVILAILAVIVWPRISHRGAAVGPAARLTWVAHPDSVVGPGDSTEVVVRVEDERGTPVAGAEVEFGVGAGRGSVSPAVSRTDGRGLATAVWRFGADSGSNALTARLRTQPDVRLDARAFATPVARPPRSP
jgi:prepilin-type N-terminal cleavage/methylation domain-containing protein